MYFFIYIGDAADKIAAIKINRYLFIRYINTKYFNKSLFKKSPERLETDMNHNKFQILEFKLSSMVINPSIVMIAKRGSGKSFITRDIIYTSFTSI